MTFIVSDRTAFPFAEKKGRRLDVVEPTARLGALSRVMHLSRVGYVGGAEKILLALAAAAVKEGREVFLACPPGPLADEARTHGVTVLPVAFSRMQITANPAKYIKYGLNRYASSRRVLELCREHGIEILHVHHPVTALYCDRAVRLAGVPLVQHVHEGPPGRILYYLALRRAAKLASRIVCVSNAGVDLLISAGVRLDKVQVVHNGVQAPELSSGRDHRTARTGDELRIAVIGMIEPRKGQDVFVEAIGMMASGVPGLKCHIIGDAPTNGSGKYKKRLISRVAKLGLQNNVEFISYVPNMIEHMTSYDVIVSSSRGMESLGFVVLEAMTQGCTVVATKVGGMEEVIQHGVNGFLAEAGCPHSLKDSIDEAISSDRRRVGQEAMAIGEHFTLEAMCAAVTSIYKSLEPSIADFHA